MDWRIKKKITKANTKMSVLYLDIVRSKILPMVQDNDCKPNKQTIKRLMKYMMNEKRKNWKKELKRNPLRFKHLKFARHLTPVEDKTVVPKILRYRRSVRYKDKLVFLSRASKGKRYFLIIEE